LGHILLLPFDPPSRLRGRPSGERRVAWSRKMALAPVKRMAASRHATINDVLVGALASAFRRYLLSHGDEPVPVRAIVPVNLRPPRAPGDSLLDEHHNWFGLVFLDLPIDDPDRESRLSKLRREMNRIKASKEAVVSLAVLEVLGRSPAIVEHLADEVFARKASLVITNVPGPRSKLRLAGRRLQDMVFWAPHPCGLGCGASILSYAGLVRVGIRSDAAVVPDPELIAHYFEQELEDWATIPRDEAITYP
jgi:WS/DGAT/MGAT family acyltransferase